MSIPPARLATARDPGCPHEPGRAYLRFVSRPVLKLRSGAHGLPPVVDHLLAGRAGAPAQASRCGAQRRRGGRRFQERSARRIPAFVPRSGATRASGPACAGVRVCACLYARVCLRVRAGAPEPPACPPLALRAVPAPGSRLPRLRRALLCLRPPPSHLLNLPVFFFFFFVSDSLCLLLLPSLPPTHTHTTLTFTHRGCDCYIPPPKGQDTREADRTLDTRGEREGSKRLGQPGPPWPTEGPENPRGASSKTSSSAELGPTHCTPGCSAERASWAPPPGRRSPLGAARAPPDSQSAAGLTPRPGLGGEGGAAGRSAPPAGPRGLVPGPGLVRRVLESLATGDQPLAILPLEVDPGARLSHSPRPASWWPGAQSRPDASLLRRPAGRVGVPGAATAARPAVESMSRPALCPRSRPIARVPQARPATSQPPPPPLRAEEGFVPGGDFLVAPSHQQHF